MNFEIKFLGQCGFLMDYDGLRIAVDPVLNDLIENGESIRNYPAVMKPEELKCDYIFCTHEHIDHLAEETIVKSSSYTKTRYIVPAGCVKKLKALGLSEERITGLSDGLKHDFVDFSVMPLSTAHPEHHLNEDGLDENLAYSITFTSGHEIKIVHLGDTYLTERLENSLKKLGKIDVLIAPINGMDEKKAAAGIIGNMNIQETAELVTKLDVKTVMPAHFDMVKGNTADPEEFKKVMESVKPGQEVWIPKLEHPFICS